MQGGYFDIYYIYILFTRQIIKKLKEPHITERCTQVINFFFRILGHYCAPEALSWAGEF